MAFSPEQFILRSFNAFEKNIALNPESIFDYTFDCLDRPLEGSDTFLSPTTLFSKTHSSGNSYQEILTTFAARCGISGSYGGFSASASASYSSSKVAKANSFYYGLNLFSNVGTISLNFPSTRSNILPRLKTDFVDELNSIKSLQDAHKFTESFGTHLILSVSLGGALAVQVSAVSSDTEEEKSMSADIKTAYESIGSIEASASVLERIKNKYSSSQISEQVIARGGKPALAAAVNYEKPETLTAWLTSCDETSVFSVAETLEIFLLASKEPQEILQKYINLRVIKQSINAPSFFQSSVAIQPFTEISAQATVPDGYKIIGGGAGVNGGNNFLTGSYPVFDSNNHISSWTAKSHDHRINAEPSETLTAYAIALYDPANLLRVITEKKSETSQQPGALSLSVPCTDIMTGGGMQSLVNDQGFLKFMLASYPDIEGSTSTWQVQVSDHIDASTNVTLNAWSIGIELSDDALIITNRMTNNFIQNQEGGSVLSQLGGSICSGGGKIDNSPNAVGNLMQLSMPVDAGTWSVCQHDCQQGSIAKEVTAYALGLTASFANVTEEFWEDAVHPTAGRQSASLTGNTL